MQHYMQSKDIYYALAQENRGIQYLMDRFDFSDENAMFEEIKRLLPSKSKGLIKNLKAMKKKQQKRSKEFSALSTDTQTEETDVQEETFVDTFEVETSEKEFDTIANSEELAPSEVVLSLDELKDYENELSNQVCKLESEHNELISKRRGLREKFINAQKALQELWRILEMQEENVTNLYEEYEACASKMEVITREKNTLTKKLDEIRKEIADRKKVTIFVFENGTIEVENADTPSISDADIASEYRELIFKSLPEADELTVKEIKTVAKLLFIVWMFNDLEFKVELEFDSTKVQKFWEAVNA